MSVYLRGAAVSVVLTLFLGVGCRSPGGSDAGSPAATYDLAVFPGDFPESESHWPAGEPIIAECWRAPDTSHVTIRTRAGERFAFTTALPPELLELDGTIRQAANVFPDERRESRRDAESPTQVSHPSVEMPMMPAQSDPMAGWRSDFEEGRRRLREQRNAPVLPPLPPLPGSPLFRAVEMAARAACR